MRVSVKSNLDEFFSQLERNVRARLPLATAIAMTKTAKDCQAAIRDEMTTTFDRPTPWTLKTVYITPATPQTQEARVYLSDEGQGRHTVSEYLRPQIEGGIRLEKRSETILREFGLLPAGMSIVPGAGARLDAYGNIARGQLQQVLSALRVAESRSGRTANRPLVATNARQKRQRAKQGEFFVSSRSNAHGRHLAPGIYQRLALRVKPIIMFVRQPSYRGRLDFNGIAQSTCDLVLRDHLRAQIDVTIGKVA